MRIFGKVGSRVFGSFAAGLLLVASFAVTAVSISAQNGAPPALGIPEEGHFPQKRRYEAALHVEIGGAFVRAITKRIGRLVAKAAASIVRSQVQGFRPGEGA